jgi:FixJ family two-component response regulator
MVAIVDDDDLVRTALQGLLKAAGLRGADVCVGGGFPELGPTA